MGDAVDMRLGAFELVESIATGGMAEVFRGAAPGDSIPVAIKVMTGELARRGYYRRQFRREVQAMAQLNHPSIATVYDLGEVGAAQAYASDGELPAGSPWMAMEFVDGKGMNVRAGTWDWTALQGVVLELLDALAHAHADGIIHRDLKPSNVMVTGFDDGRDLGVRLVDFGIARILDPEEEGDEEDRRVGTPKYMAPEQILGRRRDQGPWTDLYAVGCLVWRIVCGAAPFTGDDSETILTGHVDEQLPPFDPVFSVPEALREWLERLLAKHPDDRYRRAADAAFGLLKLVHEETGSKSVRVEMPVVSERDDGRHSTVATLDQTLTDEPPQTLPVGEPEGTESLERTDVRGLPVDRPPVPEEWERHGEESVGPPLRGAGISLFGLRKIPVVDRREERDRLWELLRTVDRERDVRGVLLEGTSGTGKTRLAQWFARRAHETGAATVLRASHGSDAEGPADGLGPMLARHFRCVGLARDDIEAVLKRHYDRLGLGGTTAHHDIVGLSRLMARAGSDSAAGPEDAFESRSERHAAIRRLLERLAQRRIVMMVFDDLQRGEESVQLVRHLLEAVDRGAPVAVVGTIDTDEVAPQEAKRVEAIRRAGATERMTLEPLEADDQFELLEEALGLEPELARRVADRTEGNPLFAVQLVGDWVERGLLRRTSEGFSLRESGDTEMPEDLGQLWELRTERLFASLPDQELETSRARLELAAALGDRVSDEEWRAVCERAGVPVPEGAPMVDTMIRRGLADRTEDGWGFGHEQFREQILHGAESEGRRSLHHRLCAETLESLYGAEANGIPIRIAEQYLATDQPTDAIPYLDRAVWQAIDTGTYDRARRLIEQHGELAERVDGKEGERYRARNRLLRAARLIQVIHPEEALEVAEEVIPKAREEGWDWELAAALRVRGTVVRQEGRLQESLRDCLNALEHLDWEEHPIETALIHRALGGTQRERGNPTRAREAYEKAAEWFRRGGFHAHQASQYNSVGYTYLMEGKLDRAEETLEEALRLAREAGNRRVEASAWNKLGEIERKREHWDEAREAYGRAVEIDRSLSGRSEPMPRANLALAELGAENYREARELLEPLIEELQEVGREVWLPGLRLALACCDVAEGDDDAGRRRLEMARAGLDESEATNPDTAWAAECLGHLWMEKGRAAVARDAFEMAEQQWKSLGRDDRRQDLAELVAESESKAR